MRGSNAKYNNPDWIGKKFGRLTVLDAIRERSESGNSRWMWRCKCECGKESIITPNSIVYGNTRSCGCLARERFVEFNKSRSHKYNTTEYKKLWWKYYAIRNRCYNENSSRYKDYGGRGIKVYSEWNDNFDNFVEWALSNGYEEGLTIERVDVNGDYCPENCKFITLEEQANNKRNTVWVEYRGERLSLATLCKNYGLNYHSVHFRLYHRGMSVEEAVETPMHENVTEFAKRCHEHNMPIKLVRDRIYKLGWDEERALTTPVRPQKPRSVCEKIEKI